MPIKDFYSGKGYKNKAQAFAQRKANKLGKPIRLFNQKQVGSKWVTTSVKIVKPKRRI